MHAHDPGEVSPPTATFNILFICTGNTCRSPLAEALARRALSERGWHNVEVGSAGVGAHEGSPASREAVRAAARNGLDISGHRARPLSPALVDWADLILVMSHAHLQSVRNMGGAGKSALLGDFVAGEDGGGLPVSDPFGWDAAVYDRTLRELETLIEAGLDRLAPILHP